MLLFERGNQDNLEGRVFIYSNLPDGHSGSNVHVIYASIDKQDMARKTSEFTGGVAGIEETITSIFDMMKGAIPEGIFPFYYITFGIHGKKFDERPEGHDVIYAGDFTNQLTCQMAMNGVLSVYAAHFSEQASLRLKTGKETIPNASKARLTPNTSYREFVGESISDYILGTYVVPMLDSVRLGQANIYERLSAEFTQFCLGAPFMHDVEQLLIISRESKGNPNLALIDAYIRKIGKIHAQEFQGAAAERDRISQILQGKI